MLKQQRSVDTRDALLSGAARAFARYSYSATRLRHIAAESGVSEGALYFHFGTKAEIAKAIVAEQQDRMTAVLAEVEESGSPAFDKLVLLTTRLADLIATDEIVQGGTRLASETDEEIAAGVRDPYFEWIVIVRALIERGVQDGSIRADVDPETAAEYINSVFVGTQVLSGLADRWATFSERLGRLLPYWTATLRA